MLLRRISAPQPVLALRQKSCLQAFVEAIRGVRSFLVATAAAPHLVPKMDAMSIFVDRARVLGRKRLLPFIIGERTKNARLFDQISQSKFRDRSLHELGPELAPDDIGRIGTGLAYSPVKFHDLASGWRLEHRSRRDLLPANSFRRKYVRIPERERLQTDNVGIGPPSTFAEQELITKEIRKPCVAGVVSVLENHRFRQNLVGRFEHGSLRSILNLVVNVEMVFVTVGKKRRDREPFHC